MVIVGGGIMPIVGMVFPTLLHIMVHFQSSDDEEPGKFHVIILLDIALMIVGLYISISSVVYSAWKMKEMDNQFLDVNVKPW